MPAHGVNPFADTEDQAALRSLARDVAARELAPMARHGDETEEFPQWAWDAMRKAELFGITIGERWGGAGLGDIEAAIVLEELARADVSSAILAQLIFNGPPRAIEHLGSDALRDKWLPLAASGEALFCIGISETEAGSSVGHMRARLTVDGDGYRLNVYKNYVTGGHKARACLVWCRFPESVGTKGIGAVVVDLEAPGSTVVGTHVKMGLRATSEAELAFDDVRIEPDDVLVAGDASNNDSFKTLISHINHERCGNAAMCIGAAQGALEYAAQYMNERKVGDRTLAQLQGLQWKIADMTTQIEGARLLLQRALHMAGPHGTPPALETAMAKTAANLAAKFVCDEAIQLLGGYGFSREYPVERVYRDIRGLCIGAGTVEIQRNFIGTSVLGGATPASDGWVNRRCETLISLDELLTRVAAPELAARVARVAGGLRAAGIEPGDTVAWQSPNREEVNTLYRACWRLGAVAVPLHHQVGVADVARMVEATRPKLVVDLDALPDGEPVAKLWTDPEQLAAVLFTSGSSGAPKGVLHSQATLAFKAAQMGTVHGLTTDDCVLMPAPCAHISGLLNGVTLPGAVPFPAVFMARWDPSVALDLVEVHRVSFMVGPPTFFLSMMEAPRFSRTRVESLRLISSGGAGVSEAFVAEAERAFGAWVKRTYGSTEAPTIVTDGLPIGPVELKLDADGELLVRGAEVCVGYLDPEQTNAAFTSDGWFRTGDLATILDGVVNIVGRKKDVIIRGGENISVTEVEEALEAHPGVRRAVAVGVPDPRLGERVCAFVVGVLDLDSCRAWFAERGLAKFKTPERVIVVEAIPLLATGKPDREALRRRIGTAS